MELLLDIPEAVWRKEGSYEFVAAWERAVGSSPVDPGSDGSGVTPGGLNERERLIVSQILANLNPKPKAEPAPTGRVRRRRREAEVS